tara:strand:- start:273 stop:2846 length:2574 start_codon:yes stop_codon:yes gene_type:complete
MTTIDLQLATDHPCDTGCKHDHFGCGVLVRTRQAFLDAEQRDPAHKPPHITQILDGEGGYELYNLIVPLMISGDARSVCAVRAQSTAWRDSLDTAILEWTVGFNALWVAHQKTAVTANGLRPVVPALPPGTTVEQLTTQRANDRTSAQERLEKWETAQEEKAAFHSHIAGPFGRDKADMILKSMSMFDEWDECPKYTPGRGHAPRWYSVNDRTVHFYCALATGACQLIQHADVELEGLLTRAGCGAVRLSPLPLAHDTTVCMLIADGALDKCAVTLNVESEHQQPFAEEARMILSSDAHARAVVAWHACPRLTNLKIAKAMARHVGLGAPFTKARLQAHASRMVPLGFRLFEKQVADFGSRVPREWAEAAHIAPYSNRPGMYAGPRLAGQVGPHSEAEGESAHRGCASTRRARPTLLYANPGLESVSVVTVQEALGVDGATARAAWMDVRDQMESDRELARIIKDQHALMLCRQFTALVCASIGETDRERYTLDELEATFHGMHKAVDIFFAHVDFDNQEHILDVGYVRELVRAVGLMTSDLPMHSAELTGVQASGRAYVYVTGIHAAQIPEATPTKIAQHLNYDVKTNPTDDGWLAVVKAAHVFDAIHWKHIGVRARVYEAREVPDWRLGAWDEVRDSARAKKRILSKYEWYITLEQGVEVIGLLEPSTTREDYVRIRRQAVRRFEALGWNADVPHVPSVRQLQEVVDGPRADRQPMHVLNFLMVTAQILCAFTETRGQGLDVLTGENGRTFIEACGHCRVDAEVLCALAAHGGSRDEEPAEPEEEPEAAEAAEEEEEEGGAAGPSGVSKDDEDDVEMADVEAAPPPPPPQKVRSGKAPMSRAGLAALERAHDDSR